MKKKGVVLFIGIIIGFFCFRHFYKCPDMSVGIGLREVELEIKKRIFDIERKQICPEQKVVVEKNDTISVIEYDCGNHIEEADGKCRFCCVDGKIPNPETMNQVCFDCELYGAIINSEKEKP